MDDRATTSLIGIRFDNERLNRESGLARLYCLGLEVAGCQASWQTRPGNWRSSTSDNSLS